LLGGPATFARDNATLDINVYNNNDNNKNIHRVSKKRAQNVFCILFYKTWGILTKSGR